jgi:hypothetical protein
MDPSLAAITGTYDTSDTGGITTTLAHIENTTLAFRVARAHDLAFALRSMDADDEEIPPNLVQTSPGLTVNRGDPDGDQRRVTGAARRTREELAAMGYEIDPVRGVVASRDFQHPWAGAAASLGPAVEVPEQQDRSAG